MRGRLWPEGAFCCLGVYRAGHPPRSVCFHLNPFDTLSIAAVVDAVFVRFIAEKYFMDALGAPANCVGRTAPSVIRSLVVAELPLTFARGAREDNDGVHSALGLSMSEGMLIILRWRGGSPRRQTQHGQRRDNRPSVCQEQQTQVLRTLCYTLLGRNVSDGSHRSVGRERASSYNSPGPASAGVYVRTTDPACAKYLAFSS